ncbi:hypothetical protein RKD37_002106 [Streptomyces ambofaciens]
MDDRDQFGPVGLRDAEQVADGADRQRHREFGHQVGAGALGQPVEEAVDAPGDAVAQRLHVPSGEGRADDPSQPGVLGRVGEDHALLHQLHDAAQVVLGDVLELELQPLVALAERAVAQRRVAVGVPAEHQGAVAGEQRGRRAAELVVEGVGVLHRLHHDRVEELFGFGVGASDDGLRGGPAGHEFSLRLFGGCGVVSCR